jgi:hypothetical protein
MMMMMTMFLMFLMSSSLHASSSELPVVVSRRESTPVVSPTHASYVTSYLHVVPM